MAIYHLSVKTFSRTSGQSATAAAAYRSGERIVDKRTGEVHDYTRKGGVVSSELVLPEKAPRWAHKPSELWNQAEQAETRKNSIVAREFEVALPSELSEKQRRELAVSFAKELVKKHGFAAQVSIHKPGKEGDQRNHHAHILVTTRQLNERGFTEKTRELDERINRGPQEVTYWREKFAELQNKALEKHQSRERVDHRTLKAQGIDREPTRHLGPAATAIERYTKAPSRLRQEHTQEQLTRANERAAQLRQEREQQERAREELFAREAAAKRQELERKAAEREQALKAAQEKAAQEREQAQRAAQERAAAHERDVAERVQAQKAAQEKAAAEQAQAQKAREELMARAREFTAKRRQELAQEAAKAATPQRTQAPAPAQAKSPEPTPSTPGAKPLDIAAGMAASRERFAQMKAEQERIKAEQERAQKEKEQKEKDKNRGRGGPER